jgi:hypothetical protein
MAFGTAERWPVKISAMAEHREVQIEQCQLLSSPRADLPDVVRLSRSGS